MKKLKLNLEDLQVESFDTTPQTLKQNGTVFGFSHECESEDTECTTCDPTAFNPPTCNGCTSGSCGPVCTRGGC